MLFGAKKKKALFDQPMQHGIVAGDQPDYDMGDFGRGIPGNAAEQPQKPSFFGQGGTGRHIAGMIGDVLSQYSGFSPTYGPQQAARQEFEQAQQAAEMKRRQGFEDFKLREKYKLDNPAPYRTKNNSGDIVEIGPDGPQVIYDDPTPKMNYIQVKDPVTGELRIVPVGPQGAPKSYGSSLPPGFQVEGGPASPAPGNFRP